MPIKDNKKSKNLSQKEIEDGLNENNISHISKTREQVLSDENISPAVKEVLDDVYTEIIKDNIETKTNKINNKEISPEKTVLNTISSKEKNKTLKEKKGDLLMKEDDLKFLYKEKLKELDEKIEDYNNRYEKLEETTQRYEDRNRELLEKRKELEATIKEFQHKTNSIEEIKNDLQNQSDKLEEAREHFKQINNQLEQKKIEFERREQQIRKIQWMLEKNRYDFEKNKLEFEKEKLEFDIGKSELEQKVNEGYLQDYSERIKEQEKFEEKEDKRIGKASILQEILKKLSNNGAFHSCFIIDNKGMMVSEYAEIKLDSMAIGAMFSLICTIALRTIDSLHLNELNFLKLASTNGEFLAKNITISNYERNFILLAFYDKATPIIPKNKQKMDKKTINKIMKSVKDDFYEFGQGKRISWIFDNLTEKINLLKRKYTTVETNLELKRQNLFNKASIQIKNIFES